MNIYIIKIDNRIDIKKTHLEITLVKINKFVHKIHV